MNSVANGKIRERDAVRGGLRPARRRRQRDGARGRLSRVASAPRAAAALRHGARATGGRRSAPRPMRRGARRAARGARAARAATSRSSPTTRRSAAGPPSGSPRARSSAGSRAGWSGERARSATAASSPIPRRADMREIINAKIKLRETFRPFAPSILEEALDEYFVGAVADPFMIQVYPVRPDKRAVIPAVTHVDGSGRLQTVSRDANPLYWQLLRAFEQRDRRARAPQHLVQRERADRAARPRRRSTASSAPGWTCWCSGGPSSSSGRRSRWRPGARAPAHLLLQPLVPPGPGRHRPAPHRPRRGPRARRPSRGLGGGRSAAAQVGAARAGGRAPGAVGASRSGARNETASRSCARWGTARSTGALRRARRELPELLRLVVSGRARGAAGPTWSSR